MYRLQNDHLTVRFDAQGRLTWLENNRSGCGNVIDAPAADSFKLVFKRGDNWENAVFGRRQAYRVHQDGNRLDFSLDQVSTPTGSAKITITLSATLEDESLVFDAVVDNQDDALVTDFFYPQVGQIRSLAGGKMALLWPQQAGEKITDIGGYLKGLSQSADRKKSVSYTTKLEDNHTLSITYPGSASMAWMALTDRDQVLHLASYDQKCQACELLAEGTANSTVQLGFDRFAFVPAGKSWTAPSACLMLYTGSWHHGAERYRDWFDSWRPRYAKPQWIQDMTGYFLVINKQQYGHEMWPYDTLPELYTHAKAHGCDTLGLFGWYDSGHDNQYPDLDVSRTLGGAVKLKKNIRAVQQTGGHVTLYVQGHLIDVQSDFYKNGGEQVTAKSIWGFPYTEQYNKAHDSSYLRRFTRKTFAIACPSCPEWQVLMRDKADFVARFGPDGVLYDQIGGVAPYPCFDETHPHQDGNPALAMSQGRVALLRTIQERTKAHHAEFGFMSEHITDVYAAYLDGLHGINSLPGEPGERGADPARGATLNYPELFRFCFPDAVITVRNKFPTIAPRMANYAFTFGFRLEMEIRYRRDCEDLGADRWPAWREYAAAVTQLRLRYRPILFRGTFLDDRLFNNGNPKIIAKATRYQNLLAVTCWNDNPDDQPLMLDVPGYRFREWAFIDKVRPDLPHQLAAGQIGLALYKEEEHVRAEK